MTCQYNCSNYIANLDKINNCWSLPGHADSFNIKCGRPSVCAYATLFTRSTTCDMASHRYYQQFECNTCHSYPDGKSNRLMCSRGSKKVLQEEYNTSLCVGKPTSTQTFVEDQCAIINPGEGESLLGAGVRDCIMMDIKDHTDGHGHCSGDSKDINQIADGICFQYGEHNEISFSCVSPQNVDAARKLPRFPEKQLHKIRLGKH